MRWLVGLLGGAAATLAFLVGAVSLTRFAGDYLGFPPGLEWTFTGAVDIAGIAGGVMWTAFTGSVRKIGRPMNVVCTLVSGVSVGLDHATHAGRAMRDPNANLALPGTEDVWPVVAFVAGVFIPALATWILHALAVIADTSGHQNGHQTGGRQETRVVVTGPPVGDRPRTTNSASGGPARTTSSTTRTTNSATTSSRELAVVRTTNSGREATSSDRQVPRQVSAAARPASATSARAELPGPRPDWMTTDLVLAAIDTLREAGYPTKRYGPGRLQARLKLRTEHQAKAVLRYIDDHDLLRVTP